jgi:hypothetical protein
MKLLIAYKTKLGASKIYADWLAEGFGIEAKTFAEVSREDLEACEACVVLSGTYAGLMPLTGFLKRNWKYLQGKKVAAIASGGIPPEHKWSRFSFWLMPKRISSKIRYWKLPGKGDEKNPIDWARLERENLEPVIAYLEEGNT